MMAEAYLTAIELNEWCIVPPNEEAPGTWTVYDGFDGEFGYKSELASAADLRTALAAAIVKSRRRKDAR